MTKTATRKLVVHKCSCCCEGFKYECFSSCTKCGNPIFGECQCESDKPPKIIRTCKCKCE